MQSPCDTTPSASPLLLKAKRLGLPARADWVDEAIARGCFHYLQGRTPPVQRVAEQALSNEELAILLISAEPDPWSLRIGGMMLGASDNDPRVIAQVAIQEQCTDTLRSIVNAALRYEPELPFWRVLLNELPVREALHQPWMPHHSRFVSTPGLIAPRTQGKPMWLRPRKLTALGYAG
jgi:hypothetical protein